MIYFIFDQFVNLVFSLTKRKWLIVSAKQKLKKQIYMCYVNKFE